MSTVISFFKRQRKGADNFQELVAPHMELLYGQAYKYTGSTHAAEDLVQDLLVELYQKREKLKDVTSLKAWLMRCLYNRFVDGYRKKKSQPCFDELDHEHTAAPFHAKEAPDTNYFHQQLLAGLELLSADQRMVISLHDIEGYTLVELGNIMNIPVGTLKSHLHRGRKTLQQKLNLQPFNDAVRC